MTASLRIPSARILTPRLLLRSWEPEDARLLKHAVDASLDHLRAWMSWAMGEPSALAVIEARLARVRDEFLAGRDWAYGLFDPAGREVLGALGLHPRAEPATLEIGYWLRVDVTGRGYATEAVRAVTRVAFEELGAERLQIRCDPRNVRSAAVPRRVGYRHTRTLEKDTTTPDGSPRDTMVWELSRAEHLGATTRPKR